MVEIITSKNNRNVIEASKLKDKKHRESSGRFCFEGYKLFEEALQSNVDLVSVFVTEKSHNSLSKILDTLGCPIYTVTNSVYEKLTEDQSPDGIFCVAEKKEKPDFEGGKVFILSCVRDPGNLGCCIRSARAFGIEHIILHDCVDPYNPKVIRASMGSFFRQGISNTQNIFETIDALESRGYNIYPTALSDSSISLTDIDINEKTVFIVGNEGHGIDSAIIEKCKSSVIIPMQGDTESLNASVAASILLWELSKK